MAVSADQIDEDVDSSDESTARGRVGTQPDENTEQPPDRLFDLRMGPDRDIEIDFDGDLAITNGPQTLEQVAAIRTGHVVRQLLGSRKDATAIEKARDQIQRILSDDPRIEGVTRVEITDVLSDKNAIQVEIHVDEDRLFEVELPA